MYVKRSDYCCMDDDDDDDNDDDDNDDDDNRDDDNDGNPKISSWPWHFYLVRIRKLIQKLLHQQVLQQLNSRERQETAGNESASQG